jgi:hypothetical protein
MNIAYLVMRGKPKKTEKFCILNALKTMKNHGKLTLSVSKVIL